MKLPLDLLYCLALLFLLFSACEKNEEENLDICLDQIEPPVITSNAPIQEGDILNLEVEEVLHATYHWHGPNGFTSDGRTPYIVNAHGPHAGTYYCFISRQNCVSDTVSFQVDIISNQAPCSPAINVVRTVTGALYDSYSNISSGIDNTSGKFVISGTGQNSTLKIIFGRESVPFPGEFFVRPLFASETANMGLRDVKIDIYSHSIFINQFVTHEGSLYVSLLDNGKLSAEFCDIQFKFSSPPYSFQFNGRIDF